MFSGGKTMNGAVYSKRFSFQDEFIKQLNESHHSLNTVGDSPRNRSVVSPRNDSPVGPSYMLKSPLGSLKPKKLASANKISVDTASRSKSRVSPDLKKSLRKSLEMFKGGKIPNGAVFSNKFHRSLQGNLAKQFSQQKLSQQYPKENTNSAKGQSSFANQHANKNVFDAKKTSLINFCQSSLNGASKCMLPLEMAVTRRGKLGKFKRKGERKEQEINVEPCAKKRRVISPNNFSATKGKVKAKQGVQENIFTELCNAGRDKFSKSVKRNIHLHNAEFSFKDLVTKETRNSSHSPSVSPRSAPSRQGPLLNSTSYALRQSPRNKACTNLISFSPKSQATVKQSNICNSPKAENIDRIQSPLRSSPRLAHARVGNSPKSYSKNSCGNSLSSSLEHDAVNSKMKTSFLFNALIQQSDENKTPSNLLLSSNGVLQSGAHVNNSSWHLQNTEQKTIKRGRPRMSLDDAIKMLKIKQESKQSDDAIEMLKIKQESKQSNVEKVSHDMQEACASSYQPSRNLDPKPLCDEALGDISPPLTPPTLTPPLETTSPTSEASNSSNQDLSPPNITGNLLQKEESSLTFSKPSSIKRGSRRHIFSRGQEVLARWHDGLYYVGKILKIEENKERCLLVYEDNSEYWALFKDMHRGAKDGETMCCLCLGEVSEKPNEIVLCDNCGLGYHQSCHSPSIDSIYINSDDEEWNCRFCTFASAVRQGGAVKSGDAANSLKFMKQTLPYKLERLTWDAHHKTNVEQRYCYCGGPGVWYQKMLQCCRCKQWFHEACIQCLEFPLLYADSFYIFVCQPCNDGKEYIKRLDVEWPDLAHITLFNLTMEKNLKYFDLNEEVMPWLFEHQTILQTKVLETLDDMAKEVQMLEALNANKSRFTCGKECRKRITLWGLRVRVPPPRTHITLPIQGPVDDEIMKTLKVKGRRSKIFVPIECQSPVPLKPSPIHLIGALQTGKHARRLFQGTKMYESSVQEDEEAAAAATALQVESVRNKKKNKVKKPLLDKLIPLPENFDSFNHPFKTEVEQNEEKQLCKQRGKILNFYSRMIELDTLSQLSDSSKSAIMEGPPVLEKEEPLAPSLNNFAPVDPKRKPKRRSNRVSLEDCRKRSLRIIGKEQRSSQGSVQNTPPNIVDQNLSLVSVGDLKSIKTKQVNYFVAKNKQGFAEGLLVTGKRMLPNSKVQYLVEWDGYAM
ncbi:hypothetical protein CHS0354_017794 [Potamilus streckersoni]|uniref:PHD-type domain-containing protein n=1 Tax=Potamilus streckersoni TaxID=2493646 RepID=A0AAE0T930_9BIVA|nr:hypothetical protein CHS0354_017794 [Potamilus streckersoni]